MNATITPNMRTASKTYRNYGKRGMHELCNVKIERWIYHFFPHEITVPPTAILDETKYGPNQNEDAGGV